MEYPRVPRLGRVYPRIPRVGRVYPRVPWIALKTGLKSLNHSIKKEPTIKPKITYLRSSHYLQNSRNTSFTLHELSMLP